MERCGSCAFYPFCNLTKGAAYCCDRWIKKNYEQEVKKDG